MWGARITGAALLLLLLAVGSSDAVADDVLASLPSGNVVDDADIIFIGRVVAVRHVHRTRTSHRRRTRYLARYRIKVRVGRVLRGRNVREDFGGRSAVWIECDNPMIPGKRLGKRRPSPILGQLESMKRGTEIIVLLRGLATDGDGPKRGKPLRLINGAIKGIASLSAIEARIAEAHVQYRTTRPGDVPRCKDPDTFVLGNTCVGRSDVLDATTCADAHRLTEERLPAGALTLGCKDAAGKWQGQRREWGWNGELLVDAAYRDGLAHGPWRSFHGGTSEVSVKGEMEGGLKTGEWTQLDRKSNKLGTYTMVAGTGTETRWTEEGKLSQQTDYRRGLEHGNFKNFTEGKLMVLGYYRRGKAHGLFVYFNKDGSVRLATCDRRGATKWERYAPKRVRKCPYGNTAWPLRQDR
jgi:hypothetical protein